MIDRFRERGVIAIAIGYLVALSWSMSNLSYDIWGIFIVLPPLIVLGVLGVRRMFSGELASLQGIMILGLLARFAGAGAKYFVSFGAYGGATDAERYHEVASAAASKVWAGDASVFTVFPQGVGTTFIEHLTSFVYTLTGTSKLAGFMLFSWAAFWGIAWFVKAGCLAIADLHRRRYALFCVVGPSIVYWPSSIGKEAFMLFAVGLATYGIARLLSRRGFFRPFMATAIGLGLAAAVRPHISGLWLAGFFPALIVALLSNRGARDKRKGRSAERAGLLLVVGVAAVALGFIGNATVRYLNPDSDQGVSSTSLTDIINETSRRTSEAGSNFTPMKITGPQDWPQASLRTLTRPLLIEAENAFQLLTALELTVFLLVCLFGFHRLLSAPRLLVTNPFFAFAMTTLFLGGLAYASFANLGVLARQKTLILPLMFLIPCLPVYAPKWKREAERAEAKAEWIERRRAAPALSR